ncbi:hypothetical protein [Sedimenticola sp.]|uniref:hypothetical protein n=1 Tax=Sedimenticola sp. TaxID=1940285 RepID=UPI003D0AA7DA
MSYDQAVQQLLKESGVEHSTMMGTPCLRYRGAFIAMMFSKGGGLIIKVSPARANALINEGAGVEFNFTKKRFKEWVIIPLDYENEYERYIREALDYAKQKLS